MVDLNPFEARILTILIKKNQWLTTAEIAKLGKMSWNTADKYLKDIYLKGWILKFRNHWKAP